MGIPELDVFIHFISTLLHILQMSNWLYDGHFELYGLTDLLTELIIEMLSHLKITLLFFSVNHLNN